MVREKIIDALNQDLAAELGAIVQYMWHHVMVEGLESPEIEEILTDEEEHEYTWMTLLKERK